jgi:hypothetical protein
MVLQQAWRGEPADVAQYLRSWARQRCGRASGKAEAAWQALGRTVYASDKAQTYEHHMKYCPTTMPEGSNWDKVCGF